jgi:hypothetical protein
MTIPPDAPGLNFRARLGRAARTFYSVKQLKTTFRVGLKQKIFYGLQDLCLHPSSKVRARVRPGRAQNAQYNGEQICYLFTVFLINI